MKLVCNPTQTLTRLTFGSRQYNLLPPNLAFPVQPIANAESSFPSATYR